MKNGFAVVKNGRSGHGEELAAGGEWILKNCALVGAVIFTLRVSEIAAGAAVILSLWLSDIALLVQSSDG